jgi:phage terminase large subunit-like protein
VDQLPSSFEYQVVAIDPSMGKTEKSDFQAVVFAGLSGGKIWIDCRIVRLPPLELVGMTDGFCRMMEADHVGCETNGFQDVLMPLFNMHAERAGMPPLPMTPIINTKDKVIRINRVDPYLANQQLRFCETVTAKRL